MSVIRFPPKAIFIAEDDGAWLVFTPRGHGWLHGSRRSAIHDAYWLSRNYGLPVREISTTGE